MTCDGKAHLMTRHGLGRDRQGFTLLELMFVVLIVLVVAAIAIPLVNNAAATFKLQGAVSSVKGAIQATRFQAIQQGCPYQINFTAATGTYQVQGQPYSAVTKACGALTNICTPNLAACPVPLAGSGAPVALNADLTLIFKPSGTVTSPQFPGGGINLTLTYGGQPPQVLQVSNYGSITP
jgi:prepilin-type N-terminal cleavage/methylation domain-containing protein